MRILLVCTALFVLPHIALAQGAVFEKWEELQGAPAPASFRGILPTRIDLSAKLPVPRSQGSTHTCTSWSVAYAAASLALRARGFAPTLTLSPSFAYNQVSRDQWCETGTKISSMLNLMRDVGALPIEEFAFDGAWCGRLPTAAELQRAKAFQIKGWSTFDATSLDKVKEQLARGVPVIFAMRVTSKMKAMRGDTVLEEDDVPGQSHAMIAIGYDDTKKAFLIQNSWGQSWAAKGYGWFGYEFWKRNVSAGFVLE
jgi:C1A family cysteine protease